MVALARTREHEITDEARAGELLRPRAATKILTRAFRPRGLLYGEALGLPARSLPELPLPPALVLHAGGLCVRVQLGEGGGAARLPSDLVLDAAEWRAIAAGAEADRLWPADFAALCARKRSDPAFRITEEVALAGAQPDPREVWPVARVLERIGARVLAIELP